MNVGYRDRRDDPNRRDRIREAWKVVEPNILSRGRCDPYWFDWDFTPIERDLWTDLRCAGVPMYPQVPVGRFFIDFGDPLERIGLEADGRDFHDVVRDRARDEILLREYGWCIYRVADVPEGFRSIRDRRVRESRSRPFGVGRNVAALGAGRLGRRGVGDQGTALRRSEGRA